MSSSLLATIKAEAERLNASDRRRYRILLESDNLDKLSEFCVLAVKLGKTQALIEQDRDALGSIAELRGQVGAAERAAAFVPEAKQKVVEYDKETERIVAERTRGRQGFVQSLASLSVTVEKGRAAVRKLAELKDAYPDVLGDEDVAMPQALA
jgi:hypothetical protein